MTAVLAAVIDESTSLNTDVIDTILAQFLRADPRFSGAGAKGKKVAPIDERQTTLLLKDAPPAYNMAKTVCNACSEKMSRYISRYLGSILAEAPTMQLSIPTHTKKSGRHADGDSDDGLDGQSETDWMEVVNTHSLMKEMWRSTPDVLEELIPIMESELQSENHALRLLAVETVGDMIAGIGKGGVPRPTTLDPAAYPSHSVEPPNRTQVYDFFTTPTSQSSFASRYSNVYAAFTRRAKDPSAGIRAIWALMAGRIILTSAGGIGLDKEAERSLLRLLAECLIDVDERVRHNAVKAIETFDYEAIVRKLGAIGGVSEEGSLLSNLVSCTQDKKALVHNEAIPLVAKIWGVAYGAIAEGNDRIATMFGAIPSTLLSVYYKNVPEMNALVDRTLFESMLPLNYPPPKQKETNGATSQRIKDSQAILDAESERDALRAHRILLLVRDLDEKAKKVFMMVANSQPGYAKYMAAFLDLCTKNNAGVIDSGEKEIKKQLEKLIGYMVLKLPEPTKAADDLHKFAKINDKRGYQLIRFCIDSTSDYKKVRQAIRELLKRLDDVTGASPSFRTNILTLIYRCSVLIYNRSHVPAIIEYSRSDENGLAATAHEILKEISKHQSQVFKTHVQDLCKAIEDKAPRSLEDNESAGIVDDLKACAQFARISPHDLPQDRKFMQSLLAYVSKGQSYQAAKHAALIVLSVSDKKKMFARDIFKTCINDFQYGKGNYLARLAALSQVVLRAQEHIEAGDGDAVHDIAITQVLLNKQAMIAPKDGEADPEWTETPDDHCLAKMLALKILVNKLRSVETDDVDTAAQPVVTFLYSLLLKSGELGDGKSPAAHATRLRLLAGQLVLKLCCGSKFSNVISAQKFNLLSRLIQDPCEEVRRGYVAKLMKYLSKNQLSARFHSQLFLLAFEPVDKLKTSTMTWIRSRALTLQKGKDTSLESLFPRLISLLAHHPDFTSMSTSDDDYVQNLKDFAQYIIFYLMCIATENNLSLIYHLAQRIKQVQDGVSSKTSDNIWILSDLAQLAIRSFQDYKGWSLSAFPKKASMPAGIFTAMTSHDQAQEVAMKQFLPTELAEDGLDDVVKRMLRVSNKKRRHTDGVESAKKKPRNSVSSVPKEKKEKKVRPVKTPKSKKSRKERFGSDDVAPSSDRRRSARQTTGRTNKSYAELSSDEEDEEMADIEEDDADEGAEHSEASEAEASEPEEAEPARKTNGRSTRDKETPSKPTTRPAARSKSNGVKKEALPSRPARKTRQGASRKEPVNLSSDKSSELSEMSDE